MPKLLREFLQEQQEPFDLELYLLERGYHKGIRSNARSCNFVNSANFFKISATFGLRKRRDAVKNCSNFIKTVFSQIVSPNNNKKIKNLGNGGRECMLRWYQSSAKGEKSEQDNSSSGNSTSMSNSCSESDAEDSHCWETHSGGCSIINRSFCSEKEGVEDGKLKIRAEEDDKQLSPVSVLEGKEWNKGRHLPTHYKQSNSETVGESSTSTPSLKRPTYTYNVRRLQELVESDSYVQYLINKRTLQQTKQLLVDCTTEVIGNHKKRDKRREKLKNILGVDELWKLVCENVWLWSQDSIDENNIIHLSHFDFLASEEEWSDGSKQQKKEISMELGDAILDSILNEVIAS